MFSSLQGFPLQAQYKLAHTLVTFKVLVHIVVEISESNKQIQGLVII